MSKIAIQGNADGSGTFTIASPNSNTDRTLTLPDEAGTVLTSAGAGTDYLTPTGDGSGLTGISSGFEFISSTDLSNNATADFTLPSGYDAYQLVFGNVIPVTNGTGLLMRTSSNSGSSFDSGGSDYNYGFTYLDMDVGNAVDSTAVSGNGSMFVVRDFVGGFGTGAGISGTITVYHPHLAREAHIYGSLTFTNSSGRSVRNEFGGTRRSSSAVNAVRFFMLSGNIHSGTITLYGMKNA